MKSEDNMAAVTRRRYTDDFKQESVRLVRESARPVAQVARDLVIPDNVLYRWRTQHRQAKVQGTTRAAQRTEAEDLNRLKRELVRVPQERDCLKRAGSIILSVSQFGKSGFGSSGLDR